MSRDRLSTNQRVLIRASAHMKRYNDADARDFFSLERVGLRPRDSGILPLCPHDPPDSIAIDPGESGIPEVRRGFG